MLDGRPRAVLQELPGHLLLYCVVVDEHFELGQKSALNLQKQTHASGT